MCKMGEINKWPQCMVDIQPILRWKNKAFQLPCEINKNCQAKTSSNIMVTPLALVKYGKLERNPEVLSRYATVTQHLAVIGVGPLASQHCVTGEHTARAPPLTCNQCVWVLAIQSERYANLVYSNRPASGQTQRPASGQAQRPASGQTQPALLHTEPL